MIQLIDKIIPAGFFKIDVLLPGVTMCYVTLGHKKDLKK